MSPFIRFCTCIVFLLGVKTTIAQSLEFVENKGQWNDRVKFKSDLGGTVFFLQQQGYKVVLHNKEDLENVAAAFSGHTHRKDSTQVSAKGISSKQVLLHSLAYEVSFVGSSPNANIIPDKPLNNFNNYLIGDDRSKWKTHCKIFQAITYENMYPGVDVRYYTGNDNLKYDVIVHPGADINKIALEFKGADKLSVKNGNLIVKTALGEVSELKPYAYISGENGRTEVEVKYTVDGNKVRFKVGDYSKNAILVIDPSLIFASFTGSAVDNWGYTATYDHSGNFYAGGIAFGSGYPTTDGLYTNVFQPNFAGGGGEGNIGGYDVAIMKLSSDGKTLIYATYLGGSSNEQPHSLVVDNNENLIVAGRTLSTNFPVTTGSRAKGGWDIFISKISPDGTTLLASTTIGGGGDDGLNIRSKEIRGALSISRNYGDDARSEVITDANNNIYLASCTQSGDFPVSANAFQKNFAGGLQDGVVIKTDPNLNIIFSSYLGGNGDDACFVLALNPTNQNIYVGGATSSNNLQKTGGNSGPVLFSSFQGGVCDGFVSIISNGGSPAQIKTCYVGGSGNDMLYGVQFDKFGIPYVTGTTTTSLPIVGTIGFTSQSNGKQYITKMQPDLSGVIYSTNFGKGQSSPDISITAFLVDRCENVYVAGWGGGLDLALQFPNAGTSGLSVTSDAIKPVSDGTDFYFFVLERNASSQLYGSFYGNDDRGLQDVGDHVDGGTSRYDREGVIYEAMCANCQGAGVFPTSPLDVYGRDNKAALNHNGAGCNEAAVKIAFELAGVGSGVRSAINGVIRDTSGCLPLTVVFTDTIATGKSFIWHFSDGTPDTTTLAPTVTHTFNSLGVFRVRLISVDSMSCNISDTSYVNIRVRNDKADLSFTSVKLPPCQSLQFQFTNTSTAPAGKPFGAQSFEWSFGDGTTIISNQSPIIHAYASSGTYNVSLRLIDTNYCNYPDSSTLQLRIADNVKAQFVTPPLGCAPYTAVFTNTSLAGQQFFWDFGDGTTSTNPNPTHLYGFSGTYIVKLTAVDSSTCNLIDSTQQTITVVDKPTSSFNFNPQVPKENTPITFTNTSTGGTLYKWSFGDGDSLVTSKFDTTISHIYNATGTYNACLIVYNAAGCSDTSCQPVQALIFPLADVPNAFTPNGDGLNDYVFVKGFGVQKMDWRIYNRWGQQVFQSSSINQGWDGRYNGVLQPQEVYVYVLNITFTDGKNFRKKGDITLLR